MKNVRSRLALASCALLSQQAVLAQGIENDWVVDSSVLNYSEADDRITVNKLILGASGRVSIKDSINLQLVYDTMSGATPTGLVTDPAALDTVTGVSGGSFSTGGGSGGALAEFNDTRLATKIDWTRQHNRTLQGTYSGAISVENDYQSAGLSANFNKDSSSRLWTFTAGIAGTFDTISRTGGSTPIPGSNTEDELFVGEATRHTYEGIVGVSRVLNSRTVAQFNISLGMSAGYHTDPYKLVSIADPGDPPIPRQSIYESRPEERQRSAIYAKMAHQLKSGNVVHFDYRYYSDDWNINSHTVDYRHRLQFRRGSYLEPHFRLYSQSAASFYTHYLDSGIYDAEDPTTLPLYVSADYRLANGQSGTLGLKYGRPISKSGRFRARGEYIYQEFQETEFPTNTAIVLQLSYMVIF